MESHSTGAVAVDRGTQPLPTPGTAGKALEERTVSLFPSCPLTLCVLLMSEPNRKLEGPEHGGGEPAENVPRHTASPVERNAPHVSHPRLTALTAALPKVTGRL